MDVAKGLSSFQKHLHPKYFYDELGSRLFERICFQPEYYLTRTESEILKEYSRRIISGISRGANEINIVELGSGSSAKTRILFRALVSSKIKNSVNYFPIDISDTSVIETANLLSADFPTLHVNEIIADYSAGLDTASTLLSSSQKTILFLGSSIGNFEYAETCSFLQMIRGRLQNSDSLLIGFDLEKDIQILEAAYNDAAGVTAAFNMNSLARINRELGGSFDLSSFRHLAFYNETERRIEMHLESMREQKIRIGALNSTYEFEEGETIHTENSYKFTIAGIEKLATSNGFVIKEHLIDKKNWFDLCLMSPE
jgi:dimethylhistidine N-methyltransferase